jgi:hypothetical protein
MICGRGINSERHGRGTWGILCRHYRRKGSLFHRNSGGLLRLGRLLSASPIVPPTAAVSSPPSVRLVGVVVQRFSLPDGARLHL